MATTLADILSLPLALDTNPSNIVPNEIRPGSRIAIIGEAPGSDEVSTGHPFMGRSGQYLFNLLARHGYARTDTSILNVCQTRPAANDISSLAWNSPEMSSGRTQFAADFATSRPNLALLCGNLALHYAMEGGSEPKHSRTRGYAWPNSISHWRGSLFWSPHLNCKCVATFHPAAVLRNYDWAPLFNFDIAKAKRNAFSSLYTPWDRNYPTLTFLPLVDALQRIHRDKALTSFDIEGGCGSLSCISFATPNLRAFSIPFIKKDGTSYWTPQEEAEIWFWLAKILSDPEVPKLAQNAAYDCFVLAYSYGILVRNVAEDTMLKTRELFPELKIGLGTQVSIFTDKHYYKDERDTEDYEEFLRYNATDSDVTLEICNAQTKLLTDPAALSHYRFNVSLLPAVLYMQLYGCRIDESRRKEALDKAKDEWYRWQYLLDSLDPLPPGKETETIMAQVCCKNQGWLSPRKDYQPNIDEIRSLALNYSQLDWRAKTHLRQLTDTSLNTSSVGTTGQMTTLIYTIFGIKPPTHKGKPLLNTDVGCLLDLMGRKSTNPIQRVILYIILRIRSVRKHYEMMQFRTDNDGRARTAFNLVGTETGRPTAYISNTGSGLNMLTMPKHGRHAEYMRRCFVADPGCSIGEVDLEGADGWTVAAHCAALGDRTMLDDYLFGLRPAKIITQMLEIGPHINRLTRPELLELTKKVKKSSAMYFTCKRGQHGSNYGLGPDTMSTQILKDTWKLSGSPLYVDPGICARVQQLYFMRYPGVRLWHNNCRAILVQTGRLRTANGSVRQFFGRRQEDKTFRTFLSHEPQSNTAYATFLALHRLWHDPENRNDRNHLIIKPMLMFYDALYLQFPTDRVDWAREKIHSYFQNPITIAGITLTIPFEGHYGPSWGETEGDL